MLDYNINSIHVQDVPGLDANAQPTVTKRVTFYAGKNGPFTLMYTAHNYTPDQVKADMEKEVATLRAICEQSGMPQ